jgi:thioesterase domain-containing protein
MSRWYRDHYEWLLTLIWEDLLKADEISIRDGFFERGGTALTYASMRQEVERYFSVTPAEDPAVTIEKLAAEVQARRQAQALKQKPFVIPGSDAGTGAVPLVYVHGVSGEPKFDPNVLHADMGRPIITMRAPGMDFEEAPLTTVDAMAERYVADLVEFGVGEPYLISGSSSSAVIAFAIAQMLEESGKAVAYAGLLEPPPMSPYDLSLPEDVELRLQDLCVVGDAEFTPGDLDATVQALKDADEIPSTYTTELLVRHAETFGRHRKAAYEYEPRGRFNGHTVLYESRHFGCGPEPLGSLDAPVATLPEYEQFWVRYLSPKTMVRRQNCEHRRLDGTALTRKWMREDIDEALRAASVSVR